jgi:hypothetical protein
VSDARGAITTRNRLRVETAHRDVRCHTDLACLHASNDAHAAPHARLNSRRVQIMGARALAVRPAHPRSHGARHARSPQCAKTGPTS